MLVKTPMMLEKMQMLMKTKMNKSRYFRPSAALVAGLFSLAAITLSLTACQEENPGTDWTPSLSARAAAVTLDKSEISLPEGESVTLTASVAPSYASNKEVTWSSSNTSVATVDASGKVTAVKGGSAIITANAGGKTATCYVTVTAKVTGVTLNKTEIALMEGESVTLTASVAPSYASNKEVTWSSSNTSVATVDASGKVTAVKAGSATITVTTCDGGFTATCAVTVKTREAVDLGLSVKWATCNVGAEAPEDYGDYYAWGETETKSNYDWSTYKWCNGSFTTQTKYCTDSSYGAVDNKTTLDLEDDVAHVKWGSKWRMPTYDELNELKNNCTWTWTTQNGKDGYKVTSKTNGNSIFLPAAGYRHGSSLDHAGSNGYYWSSSLNQSHTDHAYYLYFYSGGVDLYSNRRCYGLSVRPVTE